MKQQQSQSNVPRESYSLEDYDGNMYMFYFSREEATIAFYMVNEDAPNPFKVERHTLH